MEESSLRGGVGRAADEELGADSGGALDGCAASADGVAGGRLDQVTNEENATVMMLRQAAETIEQRARLRSAIKVNLRAEETVPRIEDHEVRRGFSEVLSSSARRAESGEDMELGQDGCTQDDQARGVSVESGEAMLNDLRGIVLRRGVEDGGWFELLAGRRDRRPRVKRCGDGEGNPGLAGSWLAGKHG